MELIGVSWGYTIYIHQQYWDLHPFISYWVSTVMAMFFVTDHKWLCIMHSINVLWQKYFYFGPLKKCNVYPYPIGSMVLAYMLTWLGYIDGIHVTIYSSTMDPSWDMLLGFIWFPMVFIWFSYCLPCSHRVRIAGPRSHRGGADVVLEKDKPWILPWVFRDLSWIYHGFIVIYIPWRYTQIWSWFLWRIKNSLTAWSECVCVSSNGGWEISVA